MVVCPNCGRQVEAPACRCGADLLLLQTIQARADHMYNQAAEAAEAGETERAAGLLQVNETITPNDLEARRLQVEVLARGGRADEAREMIARYWGEDDPEHMALMKIMEQCVAGDA